MQLVRRQRWAAVVVEPERVVGECLDVLDVGAVAGGAGALEAANYVVSGVVEDPFAGSRRLVN